MLSLTHTQKGRPWTTWNPIHEQTDTMGFSYTNFDAKQLIQQRNYSEID